MVHSKLLTTWHVRSSVYQGRVVVPQFWGLRLGGAAMALEPELPHVRRGAPPSCETGDNPRAWVRPIHAWGTLYEPGFCFGMQRICWKGNQLI